MYNNILYISLQLAILSICYSYRLAKFTKIHNSKGLEMAGGRIPLVPFYPGPFYF